MPPLPVVSKRDAHDLPPYAELSVMLSAEPFTARLLAARATAFVPRCAATCAAVATLSPPTGPFFSLFSLLKTGTVMSLAFSSVFTPGSRCCSGSSFSRTSTVERGRLDPDLLPRNRWPPADGGPDVAFKGAPYQIDGRCWPVDSAGFQISTQLDSAIKFRLITLAAFPRPRPQRTHSGFRGLFALDGCQRAGS